MTSRFLILFILFFTVIALYANDTAIEGASGNIQISTSTTDIRIDRETINIILNPDYYSVEIRYDFYNTGLTQSIMTGFPDYKYGTQRSSPIRNFKIIYGNGKEIDTDYILSEEKLNGKLTINGWYRKEITFIQNSVNTIQINYDADYGIYGFYKHAEYLLGTGRTWNDPIKELKVIVTNNSDFWIESFRFGRNIRYPYDYKFLSNGVYEVSINNFEPQIDDIIRFILSKTPLFDDDPMWPISEEYFSLKDKWLKDEDLKFLSLNQLKLMRNSIFAYRGYTFKSSNLNEYFNNTEWYSPNSNFTDSIFTKNEKENIRIIRSKESELQK